MESLCNVKLALRFHIDRFLSKTLLRDLKYALVPFRVHELVGWSSFSLYIPGNCQPLRTASVRSPDLCSSLIEGFVLHCDARLKVYQRDSIPACPNVRN